jgi:hypothetical protein
MVHVSAPATQQVAVLLLKTVLQTQAVAAVAALSIEILEMVDLVWFTLNIDFKLRRLYGTFCRIRQ